MLKNEEGFTLLHIIMIIVGFGILAAVATRFAIYATSEGKKVEAIQEMREILKGIYGDMELVPQSHFGYIGDLGEFPSSIEELYDSQGGNWDGPYVNVDFLEDPNDLMYDPWNQPYIVDYNNGTIKSTGSGTEILLNFRVSPTRLMNNRLVVKVKDWDNKDPKWFSYGDFTAWLYRVGNKATKNNLKEKINNYDGSFTFAGLTIGNFKLKVTYKEENMTQVRYVTIYPTGATTNLNVKFSTSFPQSLF